jgi:hypothetical protein
MSINDASPPPKKLLLRTADQFELWKARISAQCFFATQHDAFTITDAACVTAMTAVPAADGNLVLDCQRKAAELTNFFMDFLKP